ncbi:MAG: hypothetical protein ACP5VF_09795 [Acidobacteriota bacterium]
MRISPRRMAAVAVLGTAHCACGRARLLFSLVQFAVAMNCTHSHAFP